jgi:16S rRNA (cytosine1402-N4)-methyltransferase
MTTGSEYHAPVLLQDCVDALDLRPGGIYVDATFGGGGHSRAILEKLAGKGKLIAFDRDGDAWGNAADLSERFGEFQLVKADFRWAHHYLRYLNALPVNGVLADLGVSSHQFDTGARGFSFRHNGPLDMRMDRRSKESAEHLVNERDEAALAQLLRTYGEVDGAGRAARAIVAARGRRPLRTTAQLVEALEAFAPKQGRSGFLAQVFQALRIAVNDELGALESLLRQSPHLLKPGGRLVVLSYHSLEDRMVKHWMRAGNLDGQERTDAFGNRLRPFRPLSSKAIQPTQQEIDLNPRARSARLRIAERT